MISAATGPGGALPVASRTGLLGASMAAVARAHLLADAMSAAGLHAIELHAGRVAGRVLAPVLGPALVSGSVAAVGLAATGTAGRVPATDLPPGPGQSGPPGPPGPRPPPDRRTLALLALAAPLVEFAAAAVPGVVLGGLDGVPGSGAVLAGFAGTPWQPPDAADAAAWAGGLGAVSPLLREDGRGTVVPAAHPAPPVAPPAGVADMLRGIGGTDGGSVRVQQVRGADGGRAWIVAVPGTRDWSPLPSATPLDLTGNVHALAGHRTAAVNAVAEAMRAAGVAPAEPVLLAGHSQGGLVAARFAADPDLRKRFAVTTVVTAGAPIALAGIPRDVAVLALEHAEDPVPRLDGAANPDRPTWVTVRASAAGRPHELTGYVATAEALDRSGDASLIWTRRAMAPFLARPGAVSSAIDVTLVRG